MGGGAGIAEWRMMALTPELEAEYRAAINPAYANVRGTESFERTVLLGEIDRLRAELAKAANADLWNVVTAAERRRPCEFKRRDLHEQFEFCWHKSLTAPKSAPAISHYEGPPCSQHPDAPHGFNRDASHNAGRYVCDCEGWEPEIKEEQMKFDQAIQEAISILQREARVQRECCTDASGSWGDDTEAEADYDRMLSVAKALRDGVTAAEWHAIDYAPKDRRLLVKSESGEIYAAHWVQDPFTGDEAFCVSETPDGTQHLVKPVEWREIDPPPLQAISDFGRSQTALEENARLRDELAAATAKEAARCAAIVRSVSIEVEAPDGYVETWSMERLAQMIEGVVPVPEAKS